MTISSSLVRSRDRREQSGVLIGRLSLAAFALAGVLLATAAGADDTCPIPQIAIVENMIAIPDAGQALNDFETALTAPTQAKRANQPSESPFRDAMDKRRNLHEEARKLRLISSAPGLDSVHAAMMELASGLDRVADAGTLDSAQVADALADAWAKADATIAAWDAVPETCK